MSGIRVVTDSSCDLPASAVTEHGLVVVPLDVRLGDVGPEVMRELTPEQFWAKCATSRSLPETSAPSPGAFRDVFSAAAEEGCSGVVCVTISSELSGTHQSAVTGAEELAGKLPVAVVDSRSVSMGQGLLVLLAARLGAEGRDSAEVADQVRAATDKIKVYGALDTLENLRRGGRIGAAQALVGSLLSIKPVIEVRDGVVLPESRQRTRSRSFQYLVDKVRHAGPITQLAVLHSMAPDIGTFTDMVAEVYPREKTVVGTIGPVVGTHAGPGTVGVAYQLT